MEIISPTENRNPSDHETDAAIQKFLRKELKDVTILTVAHRLRTVMDFDKIVSVSFYLWSSRVLTNDRWF